MFYSASDVAQAICETAYPDEKYVCEVRPGEHETKNRWDKAWWAMRNMRKDWSELTYAEKEFLCWNFVRAKTVHDVSCCRRLLFKPGTDPTAGIPFVCSHNDGRVPKHLGCCIYNPEICKFVHDDFVKASANFDLSRPDEKPVAPGAPPPAKKQRRNVFTSRHFTV